MNLEQLRREYARETLDESTVDPDPLTQFGLWFAEAQQADLLDPNAMTLATATPAGRPSARVVLLKGVDHGGFVFYTDYRSRKSQELDTNPWAALLFYWGELERQVRITGRVSRVAQEMSEAYFMSRPLGSQLGAWASHQSAVLPARAELEARLRQLAARFAEVPVPLPPHWGGWRLEPEEFEFWQGRESRLHDRVRYRRNETTWTIDRLSP
ncbi:MAG TPA: pyridoxamine 5'-phosphate oxidase [Gemmatimonadales bacterium]